MAIGSLTSKRRSDMRFRACHIRTPPPRGSSVIEWSVCMDPKLRKGSAEHAVRSVGP